MKYQEALIAYTPNTSDIRVGPLLSRADGGIDWTETPIRYSRTGGAAYTALRRCTDKTKRDMMLFIEFHTIVVRDHVPIEAAHREFLKIDEYRQRIAPDVPGAEHDGDMRDGW